MLVSRARSRSCSAATSGRRGVMKMVSVFVSGEAVNLQPGDIDGRTALQQFSSSRRSCRRGQPTPDGTARRYVLNPLGVPSRMMSRQILETPSRLGVAGLGRQIGEQSLRGCKQSPMPLSRGGQARRRARGQAERILRRRLRAEVEKKRVRASRAGRQSHPRRADGQSGLRRRPRGGQTAGMAVRRQASIRSGQGHC